MLEECSQDNILSNVRASSVQIGQLGQTLHQVCPESDQSRPKLANIGPMLWPNLVKRELAKIGRSLRPALESSSRNYPRSMFRAFSQLFSVARPAELSGEQLSSIFVRDARPAARQHFSSAFVTLVILRVGEIPGETTLMCRRMPLACRRGAAHAPTMSRLLGCVCVCVCAAVMAMSQLSVRCLRYPAKVQTWYMLPQAARVIAHTYEVTAAVYQVE